MLTEEGLQSAVAVAASAARRPGWVGPMLGRSLPRHAALASWGPQAQVPPAWPAGQARAPLGIEWK
jgi:hypothetical protein